MMDAPNIPEEPTDAEIARRGLFQLGVLEGAALHAGVDGTLIYRAHEMIAAALRRRDEMATTP